MTPPPEGGRRSLCNGTTTAGCVDIEAGRGRTDGASSTGVTRVAGGRHHHHDQFGNFELSIEWKVQPKGNSGVSTASPKGGRDSSPSEMQVLNDAASAGKRATSAVPLWLYHFRPAP